ncbi:TetR/AcrR family transcriptional regulator [Microbacterium barkeri]|nr:TetR/AcrR family transcriptional regulator [Microbacterium barkeri]MDI6944921.1 TetR/AcrR family transcriptional regulator [Microbacterium barkeri]MDR6877829.1 AcrR family transcriptional regulator [Microbacterium barkeri]
MASKRGRPTADERAKRQERVLEVATELFLSRGYEAVSLDAVAGTAGIAKRTLYESIGDKSALFCAVVRRQHRYTEPESEPSDLVQAAEAVHRSLMTDQAVALHRVVIAAAVSFPELAKEFYANGPAVAQAFLAKHLVDAGGSPESAPLLFSLLLGERHRRRLLGLDAEPTAEESRVQIAEAVAVVLGDIA